MQVDVHHVEPHVARAAGAQHGVEVGPVVIHQAAAVVYQLFDGRYLSLEESQRVGVGHHHGGNVFSLLAEQGLQGLEVDGAVAERFHLHDVQPADSSRGGVGAVGGVGHDDEAPLVVATALVVALNDHEAGQLAVGTGEGLQCEGMQAGELAEGTAEQRADGLGAFRCFGGLQRVEVGKLRQCGHLLVELRVVLHRAGAEWIESVVHAEVIGRKIRIVANHGHLVAFGQCGVLLAAQLLWHMVVAEAVLRQGVALAARLRQLEYQVSV